MADPDEFEESNHDPVENDLLAAQGCGNDIDDEDGGQGDETDDNDYDDLSIPFGL